MCERDEKMNFMHAIGERTSVSNEIEIYRHTILSAVLLDRVSIGTDKQPLFAVNSDMGPARPQQIEQCDSFFFAEINCRFSSLARILWRSGRREAELSIGSNATSRLSLRFR